VADASPCVADPVPPANCASGLIIASISTSYLLVLLGLTIAIVGQFSALPVINTLLPSLLRGSALAGGVALYNTQQLTADLLRRMIAARIQEEAFGTLDRATLKNSWTALPGATAPGEPSATSRSGPCWSATIRVGAAPSRSSPKAMSGRDNPILFQPVGDRAGDYRHGLERLALLCPDVLR